MHHHFFVKYAFELINRYKHGGIQLYANSFRVVNDTHYATKIADSM